MACRRKSFGVNEGTTGARRATIDAVYWIAITGVHQIAMFAGRCYIRNEILRVVSRAIATDVAADHDMQQWLPGSGSATRLRSCARVNLATKRRVRSITREMSR